MYLIYAITCVLKCSNFLYAVLMLIFFIFMRDTIINMSPLQLCLSLTIFIYCCPYLTLNTLNCIIKPNKITNIFHYNRSYNHSIFMLTIIIKIKMLTKFLQKIQHFLLYQFDYLALKSSSKHLMRSTIVLLLVLVSPPYYQHIVIQSQDGDIPLNTL